MESDNRRYSKRESDRDRSHNRRDRPDGHREKRRTHRDKHHRGRRHRSRERRHHQDNANFEEYSGNLQGSKEPDSCKYDEPAANDYTHSNDSENHRKVFQEDNKTLSEILKADFAEFDSDEERYVSLEKKADSDDEQYMGGRKEEKTQDKSPDPFLENAKDQSEVEEESQIDESLRDYYPALEGCRSLDEFQCLNKIAEGTYGIVYRSMDKRTHDIVALKKLKMEKEREGFPITSLREINTLLKGQHENIVTVREIVFGSNNSMDKIFIVMDYIEHDLKSLMELMKKKEQRFTPGEIKCLLKQLLAAVAHLHDNWILHRDLKTSNLLLSHKGILKVGDFGLAREYGSPLKPYTPIVVTLWYRAPELLLGTRQYSTHVDMWSVGCIFAEFVLMNPIFPGKSEIEQINRIFKFLGTPSEKLWPGYNKLPLVQKAKLPHHQPASNLRKRFQMLSDVGLYFLLTFFKYDPSQRVSAEDALTHPFFNEYPAPIDPSMFPKWPAKSELGHKRAVALSPKPPSGGGEFKKLGDDGFRIGLEAENTRMGAGFSLKF